MDNLPEPIKSVLRGYCHVEWFEVDELAENIKHGNTRLDATVLQNQFALLISSATDVTPIVNALTFNEFESLSETRAWLRAIYRVLFSTSAY